MARLILLVAEGFGAGRSPVAPGTFGTLVGIGWIFVLTLPRSLPLYMSGMILGIAGAFWIGAQAEKILGKKDPGSIVIDEIAALPIAFLPVLLGKGIPAAQEFARSNWIDLILVFGFFRLFDIWKPLGIKGSQDWPGGLVWDDVLAASLAGLAVWGVFSLMR